MINVPQIVKNAPPKSPVYIIQPMVEGVQLPAMVPRVLGERITATYIALRKAIGSRQDRTVAFRTDEPGGISLDNCNAGNPYNVVGRIGHRTTSHETIRANSGRFAATVARRYNGLAYDDVIIDLMVVAPTLIVNRSDLAACVDKKLGSVTEEVDPTATNLNRFLLPITFKALVQRVLSDIDADEFRLVLPCFETDNLIVATENSQIKLKNGMPCIYTAESERGHACKIIKIAE